MPLDGRSPPPLLTENFPLHRQVASFLLLLDDFLSQSPFMHSLARLSFLITLLSFLSLPLSAAELKSYPGKLAPQTDWADGDSFPVIIKRNGKEETLVFRLYYVDCPETTAASKTDKARLLEQARHFGVKNPGDMIPFGKQATKRTRELLAKPFEVHTAFANAMGRSRKPRSYAMIKLSNGDYLSATLVREGLARVKGINRGLIDGTHSNQFRSKLNDLALAAAIRKSGIWKHSTPEQIIQLREQDRIEKAKLDAIVAPTGSVNRENPADINNDPIHILTEIKGIGPATAKKIIAARPFTKVDDLLKVQGIGNATLNKIKPFLTCKPQR